MADAPEPHVFVIFGATGDLSRRKLLPAIANLAWASSMGERYAVLGVGRSEDMDDAGFRAICTQALVDALNKHVLDAGGRIYLAKDALTRPEDFRAMEPRLDAWNAVRRRWDPEGRLKSALSVRLLGDEA